MEINPNRCVVLSLAALLLITSDEAFSQNRQSYKVEDLLTADSPSHSRDKNWKPSEGIAMEVSGMEWLGSGRLAVAIRKGEVWMIDGVLADQPTDLKLKRFASGLHEPLGLTKDGGDLLVSQRSEITRLRDRDGDGIADSYLTEASGWGVSGAYHAYAYGPERDGAGNLWVTLNLDMGEHTNNDTGWRGWGGLIDGKGGFRPMAGGMRSPSGLGANLAGDMFFSDQQGTWIPATPIYHLREGVFFGNQEGLGSQALPGSPLKMASPPTPKQLYPDAIREVEAFVPPAVWLPYNKMGRSATDIEVINTGGKFGPFDGQLLVGEFTNAAINRVFLERVDGVYQGACFPFMDGFAAAVLRLTFALDGSLFVGMSNRGWSSLGSRSYGLQRVRFAGETPFAIKEMRAKSDGFELKFTQAVDVASAAFELDSFTYEYSSRYGGDEEDAQSHPLTAIDWSDDRKSVRIGVDQLRQYYLYELRAKGLTSESSMKLDHPNAWYTLNRIPRE